MLFVIDGDDLGELGQAVQKCLAASREGVPHPDRFTDLFNPILSLAGVKSFGVFMKSAKCVEVELDAAIVTLIPTRNAGVENGFSPLLDKAKTLDSEVADRNHYTLGLASATALALAE